MLHLIGAKEMFVDDRWNKQVKFITPKTKQNMGSMLLTLPLEELISNTHKN